MLYVFTVSEYADLTLRNPNNQKVILYLFNGIISRLWRDFFLKSLTTIALIT